MTNGELKQFEQLFEEKIIRLEQAINHVKELKEHDLIAAETSRNDLKELMAQRFEAYDRAMEEARASLGEYKAQANEWRGQSKDQAEQFISRTEALGRLNGIDKQISDLQSFRNQEGGKELAFGREKLREGRNIGLIIAIVIAIISSAIAVIAIIVK